MCRAELLKLKRAPEAAGGPLTTRVSRPTLRVSDSAGLGWGLGIYICNQFLGDDASAGPRDLNENPGFKLPFACTYVFEEGWQGEEGAGLAVGPLRATVPLQTMAGTPSAISCFPHPLFIVTG